MHNGPGLLGSSTLDCEQLVILFGMVLVVLLPAGHSQSHTSTNLLGLKAPYFD
jgi:hypothetical protein